MPTVWELRCPKRIRSRRALFQEGVEALRRDAGVRRVTCSKTFALLQARVIFWNDGPTDAGLARLREEFGPGNVNQPAPPPQRLGALPRVALDFETSMGCMVSAAQQAGRSIARVNFSIQEQDVMQAIASVEGHISRRAAAMVAPIRRLRDYASLGRRIFNVEQLPPGALPLYDREIVVPAGTIYAVSEPEFMGRFPVRTELTVLGPDDPNRLPFSRILFMDYHYGAVTNLVISHMFVPKWVVPGAWAYDQSTGRFAFIRRILSGNHRAGVSYWYQWHLSRRGKVISAEELHDHWNPCDGPKFPRESWWEDLLQDDFEGL